LKDNTPFKIYNASAGSGKTFTLVKEYISRILKSKNEAYYQHLLAITFTNKAVAEMKKRILENLVSFTSPEVANDPPEMLVQIAETLELSFEEIRLQSVKIVKHLLHHYASFSVETIDSFNHRLIRTFARDLRLTANFEVSLDTPILLAEAVDQLIHKAGEDPKITKVLLDYALAKTDDDKSWDISKDIVSSSGILFKENESTNVAKLKKKTLDDFDYFKKQLQDRKEDVSEEIHKIAADTLRLMDESRLEHTDFTRSSFPKYLVKLELGDFSVKFISLWHSNFGEKPLYTGATLKKSPDIANIIDELAATFVKSFTGTKALIFQFRLFESILKSINPLSVINLVQQEVEAIKKDKNILPISEFNALINNEIKNQPVPFIYERLGEKYRHFFIDEFQDTSQLQWENLTPLISNAISQFYTNETQGSLLLAGDAKQSIYRWRGGLPEQFMNLCRDDNPFPSSQKEVLNLERNYRSGQHIIDFNNQFFSFIATYFGDDVHRRLYEIGNNQEFNNKQGGFIRLTFIEKAIKKEQSEIYGERILETIKELKAKGFEENDICILTRNRKEGISIGSYLMANEISVISAETLLLQSSRLVQCLLNTLKLSMYPENEEAKVNLLDFLHDYLSLTIDKHSFFSSLLKTSLEEFKKGLIEYKIVLDFKLLQSYTVYECCEYMIRQFQLFKHADAYLFSFMDFVFEFEQSPLANKISFFENWERKKDKTSIPANEGTKAVQLMTIHKAKGLEFPVVLFPFADVNIYDARFDSIWYPLDPDLGFNFDEAHIKYKQELSEYSDLGATIYNEHQNKLELDNLNLLYVTLTRAAEELYIFAEKPSAPRNNIPLSYNQFFGEFLKSLGKWNEAKSIYEFGNPTQQHTQEVKESIVQTTPSYTAISPNDHNLKIVASNATITETGSQKAITEGNLLHDLMAQIYTKENVASVFNSISERAIISFKEIEFLNSKILSIVEHPLLRVYFKESCIVLNEREIITASGLLLRPDRLNFNQNDSITIIDYKTGEPNYRHEDQINSYASALEEMGKHISERLLVYTNQEEIVINKV
jgi:ATP-dependent exoDNAse (exonuclease V) beta subunit